MTKTKRLTATIERYHVYGTMRHELRVTHRGRTLRWSGPGMSQVWAIVQDDPSGAPHGIPDDVLVCQEYARRQGFTHVRIAGDWDRRTKPAGGAL